MTTQDAGDGGLARADGGTGDGPIVGVLADGEEVRILGSGFPPRAHARPLVWADFETGAAPTPLGRLTEWSSFGGEWTDVRVASGSTGAVRFDHGGDGGTAGGSIDFDSDVLYVFIKRYYDYDITDPSTWGARGFNHKTIRLWRWCGRECDYRRNNIYFGYQGMEGGNPRVTAEYTGVRTVWDGPEPTADRWLQQEWLYRAGQIEVQDGVFGLVQDGIEQWEGLFRMRDGERPDRYDRLYFDQVSNGTGAGSYFSYHDDLYIDTTWTRVMVTDAPTLAESRVREIQVPLEWSDTEIRVLLRRGAHATFEGRHLLVIGDDGSEQSFPL